MSCQSDKENILSFPISIRCREFSWISRCPQTDKQRPSDSATAIHAIYANEANTSRQFSQIRKDWFAIIPEEVILFVIFPMLWSPPQSWQQVQDEFLINVELPESVANVRMVNQNFCKLVDGTMWMPKAALCRHLTSLSPQQPVLRGLPSAAIYVLSHGADKTLAYFNAKSALREQPNVFWMPPDVTAVDRLTELLRIVHKDLQRAIYIAAAKCGRLDVVQHVQDENVRSAVFLTAVQHGQFHIVEYFLPDDTLMHSRYKGTWSIVCHGISHWRQYLMDDERSIIIAVNLSCAQGNLLMAQALVTRLSQHFVDDRTRRSRRRKRRKRRQHSQNKEYGRVLGSGLQHAAENGHVEVVQWLLSADLFMSRDLFMIDYCPMALRNAAMSGHLDIVELLVHAGVNVKYAFCPCCGPDWCHALTFALENNKTEVAKYLIDKDFYCPLEHVLPSGNGELVKLWLRRWPVNEMHIVDVVGELRYHGYQKAANRLLLQMDMYGDEFEGYLPKFCKWGDCRKRKKKMRREKHRRRK